MPFATGSKGMLWKKSDGKRRNKRSSGKKPRNPMQKPGRGRMVYLDAGRQALKDINILRRFINTEIKRVDYSATETSSTTATFDLLNGMAQGTTASTRVGQSVKCDGIFVRLAITINASATTSFERVLVVMDKQANGAAPAIGSILNATTVVSPFVIGAQNRFAILMDESFALSAGGIQCVLYDKSIACSSHVEYNTGSAGTIADINTNSIYLIHFSDQATNVVSLSMFVCFWFIDN